MKSIARFLTTALAAVASAASADDTANPTPGTSESKVEIGPVAVAISVVSADSGKAAKTPYLAMPPGPSRLSFAPSSTFPRAWGGCRGGRQGQSRRESRSQAP